MAEVLREAPAAAAGAACGVNAEAFEEWASRQRRRAALDGAWKVEVTERMVVGGGTIRSVATWHDNAKHGRTPVRRTHDAWQWRVQSAAATAGRAARPARGTHEAVFEAATQQSPECCTSQGGSLARSAPLPACSALPCTTVALDSKSSRAARRAFAGQAPPLPASARGHLPTNSPVGARQRCAAAASQAS